MRRARAVARSRGASVRARAQHGVDASADRAAMQRITEAAERAKCELSEAERAQVVEAQQTRRVALDARSLSNGSYVVRVEGEHFGKVRRLTLVR